MLAYVIVMSKPGKPTLYRSRVPDRYGETDMTWLPNYEYLDLITSDKEVDEKIDDLIKDFNKGNGEDSSEPFYVGKMRDDETYTHEGGAIGAALIQWTPIGEVIQADFQLSVARIHLEMVKYIMPEVDVVRIAEAPKPIPVKPPRREISMRYFSEKDTRYRETVFAEWTDAGLRSAVLVVEVKDLPRLKLTIDGKMFRESDLSPTDWVALLKERNNLK